MEFLDSSLDHRGAGELWLGAAAQLGENVLHCMVLPSVHFPIAGHNTQRLHLKGVFNLAHGSGDSVHWWLVPGQKWRGGRPGGLQLCPSWQPGHREEGRRVLLRSLLTPPRLAACWLVPPTSRDLPSSLSK